MSSSTGRPSASTRSGPAAGCAGRAAASAAGVDAVRVVDAQQRGQRRAGGQRVGLLAARPRWPAAARAAGRAPRPATMLEPVGPAERGRDVLAGAVAAQHRHPVRRDVAAAASCCPASARRAGEVDHADALDAVASRSASPAVTLPPSMMTTWYGRSLCGSAGVNRGRSLSSLPSSSLQLGQVVGHQPDRARPRRSRSGCIACGSHLTQSQWGIALGRRAHADPHVVGGVERR